MFKPGEIARLNGLSPRTVTILADTPAASRYKWPIATSEGVFDETELSPAHPSVLATAEGRDLATEASRRYMDALLTPEDMKGGMSSSPGVRTRRRAEPVGPRTPTCLCCGSTVKLPRLKHELRKEVEKALGKAKLDLNGHWKNGAYIDKDFKVLEKLFLGHHPMTEKDAVDFVRAAKAKKPMDRWVPIDVNLRMTLRRCPLCVQESFGMETNGLVVRLTGEPCPFPNGLPLTEWELNVPSGKLVIANDLREAFPLPEEEDFDINTKMGCRQTALAYAANGLSHAFVGNTSPGVYECSDGTFKIATEPSDTEWDGKEWVEITPAFDGKRVAGICTDLWWYSICDHDEYQRRCKRFNVKTDRCVTILDVKPGVYRFRHNEEARGHDEPGECVYTRFEWVREPDPVKDYLTNYEEVEVNAHAYVQAQAARWPTLYGHVRGSSFDDETPIPWSNLTVEQRLHSWQRVADHVLCTIGGGVEWHEKGFPRAKVDPSVPDVEPPAFRAQYHWYPFSKPYGGLYEPKTLAPSFAKLAFRVLESIISFGMTVNDGQHSREVRYVRQRMLAAVERYRELAELHPEHADPEYVAWLSEKGRAEAWVESFPLGPEFTEKHRENVKRQRWVPEDAYAVAFDARKLKEGHFAWHPKKGGCWANKKDAQRYAILAWKDNGQPDEHNCFWTRHATNTSVPLYFVARVLKVGEVSHMGETLVELAFDYGTPWMRDKGKRKAVAEAKEKDAIRVLSRKEYERLLQSRRTEPYDDKLEQQSDEQ